MHRVLLTIIICLGSLAAQATVNAPLEQALTNSALMYGAYGDESVICGGDLLSYHIVSETSAKVTVQALITQQVNYCASVVQVQCLATYAKGETSYLQESFVCDSAFRL